MAKVTIAYTVGIRKPDIQIPETFKIWIFSFQTPFKKWTFLVLILNGIGKLDVFVRILNGSTIKKRDVVVWILNGN